MKSKDYILGRLRQRINDMYGDWLEPCANNAEGKQLFTQRSYSRWAACEYYRKVAKADDIYVVSEYFIRQMNNFACKKHPNTRMFSVAYDVATDLNDFLLTL